MMKQINFSKITLLLFLASMVSPLNLQAEELINQSSNIFKFQQKLAMNGNVHAQYKLAEMYEKGDGVSASIEQAKHWYGRAADAGSKPAIQRNTFLEVKEQGYDPAKHADWLNSVKTDADSHNAEATNLLAQLYGEGIGVKKDLVKSLELLKQVRILGVANVDKRIARVEKEIAAIKRAEQENARLEKAKEEPRATKPVKQQVSADELAKQRAEAERLKQAEKIRRYEQAMRQLQREQQLIDEQQAWASGGTEASVDDEI